MTLAIPNDLTTCQALVRQLHEALHKSQRENEQLLHRLQVLLKARFGPRADRVDPNQLALFATEILEQVEKPAPTPTAQLRRSSSGKPNGHGRRRLPADLPREQVVHDLSEEEKPCPCCGEMRHVIGQEVSEQIDYVPPKVSVVEHVQLKYACRHCEQQVAEDGPQITTAEKPLSPIEKGLAAPGLLAYVIVSKYSDHLPLHRLERILERYGIEIARSTMCDWMAQCAALFRPLHERLVHNVRQSDVIHTDDTPVEVLDRNLDRTRTGRLWVYLGDPAHPYTVFTCTASRSRDGPMQFLKGWGEDRPVYLQADAFGGYDGIYAGQAGGRVTEVACWAHARRKFYEARTSDAAASTQALAYIRLLYDVEDEAKEQFEEQCKRGEAADRGATTERDAVADHRELSAVRQALRQEHAVPRLEQFKAWLLSQQAEHGGPVLPKSPMGQAITYALNQWEALSVYAADGRLAKRSRALRGRNSTRDSQADGAPKARAPWSLVVAGLLPAPLGHRSHALQNPGVWGGAPGASAHDAANESRW